MLCTADPYGIGDGRCYNAPFNTAECGYDGGDCLEFNKNILTAK